MVTRDGRRPESHGSPPSTRSPDDTGRKAPCKRFLAPPVWFLRAQRKNQVLAYRAPA